MNKPFEYEKKGPKAVILFHAYTGTPNDVSSVGRALQRENYTVLMPTFDGHGETDPDEILKYGIEDWLKNGEAAYQQLVADGFTDISVFGLSLGGIIATDVMLNHDVKRYGVFSSPVISTSDTNVPENFWKWYAFMMKKNGADAATIEAKQPEVSSRLNEVLSGIDAHIQTMSEKYASVELPVFIGQGGADEMISAEQAYEMKDAFTAADISFHYYEDAPHVITTGRIGKEVQKDLLVFLKK